MFDLHLYLYATVLEWKSLLMSENLNFLCMLCVPLCPISSQDINALMLGRYFWFPSYCDTSIVPGLISL